MIWAYELTSPLTRTWPQIYLYSYVGDLTRRVIMDAAICYVAWIVQTFWYRIDIILKSTKSLLEVTSTDPACTVNSSLLHTRPDVGQTPILIPAKYRPWTIVAACREIPMKTMREGSRSNHSLGINPHSPLLPDRSKFQVLPGERVYLNEWRMQ